MTPMNPIWGPIAGVFIVLMLVIESLVVQPLERRANRWRRRLA